MARASLNDVFQGIFQKKNMGIEFTAKFITTEPLTFFNKSSPGDLSATTIGTSMSWVTCFIYIENETGTSYISAKGLVDLWVQWNSSEGYFIRDAPVTNH